MSSWFDKERREFNGYGYLREEMEKNSAIITTRDIAEAEISRLYPDSRKLNNAPKNVGSNETISGEENPRHTEQR